MKECLEGLKVVELGAVLAGPFVGGMMADFGANVIKIETQAGDTVRGMGKIKDLWFTVEGRNKKTITLNLKEEEGKEILGEILEDADILIENFRPGVLDKLGFGWQKIHELYPRLILVSISGYGQTGPYKDKPGFNRIGLGMGGLSYVTGFPDGPPTIPGLAIGDYLAGTFAGLGAMYAVYNRDIVGTGKGQHVDCSLYEPILRIMESGVVEYKYDGTIKERAGNRHQATVPSGHYLTKDDSYLVLAVGGNKVFKDFAEKIGRPDLVTDERFTTGPNRTKYRDDIEIITEEWVRAHTIDECLEIFGDDVPCCKVYSVEDFFNDPQFEAREDLISIDTENFGKVWMQGIAPKLSETPGKVKWAGPELGAWNEKFYVEEFGMSKEKFEELKEKGVIR